jgi:hypothetical protein
VILGGQLTWKAISIRKETMKIYTTFKKRNSIFKGYITMNKVCQPGSQNVLGIVEVDGFPASGVVPYC